MTSHFLLILMGHVEGSNIGSLLTYKSLDMDASTMLHLDVGHEIHFIKRGDEKKSLINF